MSGISSSNYNYMEAHRADWECDERTRVAEAEKERYENALKEFEKAATEDFTKESETIETRISNLNYEITQLETKKHDLLNTRRLYEMLLAQMKKQNAEKRQKRKFDEEK